MTLYALLTRLEELTAHPITSPVSIPLTMTTAELLASDCSRAIRQLNTLISSVDAIRIQVDALTWTLEGDSAQEDSIQADSIHSSDSIHSDMPIKGQRLYPAACQER